MNTYFIFDYDTNTFKELTVQEFLNKLVTFEREQFQLSDEQVVSHIKYYEDDQTTVELFDMLTSVKEIVSVIHQDSECELYVVIK